MDISLTMIKYGENINIQLCSVTLSYNLFFPHFFACSRVRLISSYVIL